MIVECPGCRNRYDVTGRPPGTRARCRCGTIFELPAPERQAAMLACPKCGGAVAPTNHQCEYCSAQLLVRACPRCFARIFHGAEHCSSCGAQSVVPARAKPDGDAEQLSCPRCSEPLVGRLVDEVLLDECGRCHGVWVDQVALERMLRERRQARADRILGEVRGRAQGDQAPHGPIYIRCPECETMMNRRLFARGSGVVVDTCRSHGTWFDGGELPSLIDFVMKGGLEVAARKDAELLREQERRARTIQKVEAASRHKALTAARPDRVIIFGGLLGQIAPFLVD